MNVERASLAATAVLVVAVLTLLARHALLGSSPVPMAVQIAAGLLMLWARLTFGGRSFNAAANPTSGGVVTKGPYRFVRHPIYAAIIYFVWAGVISHAGVLNASLALLATAMVALRIVAEDRLLLKRYPEYAPYAASTKRVVPFVL